MHLLKKLLDFLIYGNVWVATCAAGLTYSTSLHVGASNPWSAPTFVFFSTVFAYNFQRIFKFKAESTVVSPLSHWINTHKSTVTLLMWLGGVGAFVTLFFLPLEIVLMMLPFGVVSINYSTAITPSKKKRRGLRDIPGAKIFIIALTWTCATYMLPLGQYLLESPDLALIEVWKKLLEMDNLWFFLERFAFVLAITIPFDIRDLAYDSPNKKTIPQVIGANWSKLLAVLLLIFSLSCYFELDPEAAYGVPNQLTLVSFYALGILLVLFSNAKRKDTYFTFWIEGLSLLFGVTIYLLQTL